MHTVDSVHPQTPNPKWKTKQVSNEKKFNKWMGPHTSNLCCSRVNCISNHFSSSNWIERQTLIFGAQHQYKWSALMGPTKAAWPQVTEIVQGKWEEEGEVRANVMFLTLTVWELVCSSWPKVPPLTQPVQTHLLKKIIAQRVQEPRHRLGKPLLPCTFHSVHRLLFNQST